MPNKTTARNLWFHFPHLQPYSMNSIDTQKEQSVNSRKNINIAMHSPTVSLCVKQRLIPSLPYKCYSSSKYNLSVQTRICFFFLIVICNHHAMTPFKIHTYVYVCLQQNITHLQFHLHPLQLYILVLTARPFPKVIPIYSAAGNVLLVQQAHSREVIVISVFLCWRCSRPTPHHIA